MRAKTTCLSIILGAIVVGNALAGQSTWIVAAGSGNCPYTDPCECVWKPSCGPWKQDPFTIDQYWIEAEPGDPSMETMHPYRHDAVPQEQPKKVMGVAGIGLVYLYDGGTVQVVHQVTGEELRRLTIPTSASGPWVDFWVHDDGDIVIYFLAQDGTLVELDYATGQFQLVKDGGYVAGLGVLVVRISEFRNVVLVRYADATLGLVRIEAGQATPFGVPFVGEPVSVAAGGIDPWVETTVVMKDGRSIGFTWDGEPAYQGPSLPLGAGQEVIAGQMCSSSFTGIYLTDSGDLFEMSLPSGTSTLLTSDPRLAGTYSVARATGICGPAPLPQGGMLVVGSPDRPGQTDAAEVHFLDAAGRSLPNFIANWKPEGGTWTRSGVSATVGAFLAEIVFDPDELLPQLVIAKYDRDLDDYGDQDFITYSLVRKASTGEPLELDRMQAYAARGGMTLASLDTHQGISVLVTGAGPGPNYGPQANFYERDISDPMQPKWVRTNAIFAYGTMKFGVNVAAGDVDGDGEDELLTGAGPGKVFGPHVRCFKYDRMTKRVKSDGRVNFFGYSTLEWGVNVSAADINGNGRDEVLIGPGPGPVFGQHLRGFELVGNALRPTSVNYMLLNRSHGSNVAGADLNRDGRAECVAAPGPDPTLQGNVAVIDPLNVQNPAYFLPSNNLDTYGARVFAFTVGARVIP